MEVRPNETEYNSIAKTPPALQAENSTFFEQQIGQFFL
jgi:hypothetical protein